MSSPADQDAKSPAISVEPTVITIDDFASLRSHTGSTGRWMFRGQSNSDWGLSTRLERHTEKFKLEGDAFSRKATEEWMLREFRRSCHHHVPDPPANAENLEWLSLMQHHGAPTRLMDWTFSEWVALFFALRDAEFEKECAVWAIDQMPLWEDLKASLPSEHRARIDKFDKAPEVQNWLLFTRDQPMVAPLNPMRLTERLSVQQGTFLVPLAPEKTFGENLNKSLEGHEGILKQFCIKCTQEEVIKGFTLLQRMNVSHLSLFRGLDGFATGLRERSVLKHLRVQV